MPVLKCVAGAVAGTRKGVVIKKDLVIGFLMSNLLWRWKMGATIWWRGKIEVRSYYFTYHELNLASVSIFPERHFISYAWHHAPMA